MIFESILILFNLSTTSLNVYYSLDWRDYMELTRFVAFHHAKTGEIGIFHKGNQVFSESVTGPIRLKVSINNENK